MAVSAEKIYIKSKCQQAVSKVFDLSTAIDFQALLFDSERELVIWAVDIVYVTENPAAASTITIGTVSAGSISANVYTGATASSGTKGDTAGLTLLTTLAKASGQHHSRPVLSPGTLLAFKNTASGGAGEVQVVISYYPIQPSTDNYI